MPVALKFMFVKSQFLREINVRACKFNADMVIDIIRTHPSISSTMSEEEQTRVLASYADSVELDGTVSTAYSGEKKRGLSKGDGEKLFLVVMPLAERNLFVVTKQERHSIETSKHIVKSLITSLMHMHSMGVLHGDIKPLNVMRTKGEYALIDLDAACTIGRDAVGFKSSSAYVPPEAVFVNADRSVAVIKSEEANVQYGDACQVLIAHESFDVWSVGCICFQLLSKDIVPLWQCGQDDNLSFDISNPDSLYALADFSGALKAKKMDLIQDPLARNLVAQMLTKDPRLRPSLVRVLAHPFFSGNRVARLFGDKPRYDVMISYRVASDQNHADIIYKDLTALGLTVWWDKECLRGGKDWEEGFCDGLLDSRAMVCIISRDAINSPDVSWQNYGNLTESSRCDNVLLEQRLALEMKKLGLLQRIFPVFIGTPEGPCGSNPVAPAAKYEGWKRSNLPAAPNAHVQSVEEKLVHHMSSMALGMPLETNKTVKAVLEGITSYQGVFVQGVQV